MAWRNHSNAEGALSPDDIEPGGGNLLRTSSNSGPFLCDAAGGQHVETEDEAQSGAMRWIRESRREGECPRMA